MSRGRSLQLALARSVPGWVLRLAVPLAAVAAEAVAVPAHVPARALVVAYAATAALLARTPAGPAGPALVLLAALLQLARPVDVSWRTSLLVLLLHAVLVLAALAGHVAWRSRVELAVLRGVLRDALPGQAVAQLLLLALGPFGASAAPHPWARLLALAAALGVALLARASSP